jgi:hypothetical protein
VLDGVGVEAVRKCLLAPRLRLDLDVPQWDPSAEPISSTSSVIVGVAPTNR